MDANKEEYRLVKVSMADPEYEMIKFLRESFSEGISEESKKFLATNMHAQDEDSDLYLFYKGEVPVASVRFIREPEALKLGRMVVQQELQRKGIGSLLVRQALELYKDAAKQIYLWARIYLRDFYAKFKFQEEGEPFFFNGFTMIKMVYKA